METNAAAAEAAAAYLAERGASIRTLSEGGDAAAASRRTRLAVEISDVCSSECPVWTGRDEDLARLVDVPNVEAITFDRQFVHPSALAFLPKMNSLRALCFTFGCPVNDEVVRIVSECRGIDRLVVFAGDISSDGAAQLAKLTSLRELFLVSPRTTDKGVAALSVLANLEELRLPVAKVTDSAVPRLAKLSKLRELGINGSPITDKGLGSLAKLGKLRKLDISGTRITDKGLPSLAKLQSLEVLDVRGTGVTEAGVRSLQAALPRCKIVYGTGDKSGRGARAENGRGAGRKSEKGAEAR